MHNKGVKSSHNRIIWKKSLVHLRNLLLYYSTLLVSNEYSMNSMMSKNKVGSYYNKLKNGNTILVQYFLHTFFLGSSLSCFLQVKVYGVFLTRHYDLT